jgi:hypothetical protein
MHSRTASEHTKLQWSGAVQRATRAAIEEFAFLPNGDDVCFKHANGRCGTIAVADLFQRRLTLVDRNSGQETAFANAEALIQAGWVVD